MEFYRNSMDFIGPQETHKAAGPVLLRQARSRLIGP
ncbi:MAG: hypothetical protein RLZ97_2348 [Verrucomicrobiota bacterium]|jgi:hypothetical protein